MAASVSPLDRIKHSGWVSKAPAAGVLIKGSWNRRWMVLTGGCVRYYEQPNDVEERGTFNLFGYQLVTPEGKGSVGFSLVREGERTYEFLAESDEDREQWVSIITQALEAVATQATATSATGGRLTGFLHKAPGAASIRGWQKRWFVLQGDTVMYFDDQRERTRKGMVVLTGLAVEANHDVPNGLVVGNDSERAYQLKAQTLDERDTWITALKAAALLPPGTGSVLRAGWIEKLPSDNNYRSSVEKWKRRWFVLERNALFYFEDQGERVCKGVILLDSFTADVGPSEREITMRRNPGLGSLTYHLRAPSPEDAMVWIQVLQEACSTTTVLSCSYFPDNRVPAVFEATPEGIALSRPGSDGGRSRWTTIWNVAVGDITGVSQHLAHVCIKTRQPGGDKEVHTPKPARIAERVNGIKGYKS